MKVESEPEDLLPWLDTSQACRQEHKTSARMWPRAQLLRRGVARAALAAPGAHRAFRVTRPAEVGPLIAGVGLAAAFYGAKLLIQASQNPKFQEAMRGATSAAPADAGGRAKPPPDTSRAADDAKPTTSYFTTEVMGIDLGQGPKEWSSAVAAVVDGGEVRVVETEHGRRSTPAVVTFREDGETLVGLPAKKLLLAKSATAVFAPQLLFGLQYGEEECAELVRRAGLPFALCEGEGGAVSFEVHGVAHTPSEIAARLLGALKADAERSLGRRGVLSAVVGVPPGAREGYKRALLDAGQQAGLQLERLPPCNRRVTAV